MTRKTANQAVQFLVIGAQKAGTTSLFRYLSAHPQIFMPGQKELAYFSDDERYTRGREAYLSEHFSRAVPGQVCGEASPHYMCFQKCAERIQTQFPQVRLLAVLRNPVDRAYSHYRMAQRRGLEPQSFGRAVHAQLLRRSRDDAAVDLQRDYVGFGEYGRILANFLRYFARSQLQVVWSDELDRDVALTMPRVYDFLGVRSDFQAAVFSRRYHRSGGRRFPAWFDGLCRRAAAKCQRFTSPSWVQWLAYWYETECNVRVREDRGPDSETREMLIAHYAPDIAKLEDALRVEVPWPEFRSSRA